MSLNDEKESARQGLLEAVKRSFSTLDDLLTALASLAVGLAIAYISSSDSISTNVVMYIIMGSIVIFGLTRLFRPATFSIYARYHAKADTKIKEKLRKSEENDVESLTRECSDLDNVKSVLGVWGYSILLLVFVIFSLPSLVLIGWLVGEFL